jgi:hypothetical protein
MPQARSRWSQLHPLVLIAQLLGLCLRPIVIGGYVVPQVVVFEQVRGSTQWRRIDFWPAHSNRSIDCAFTQLHPCLQLGAWLFASAEATYCSAFFVCVRRGYVL